MNPIFPDAKIPLDQRCLLFHWFKEIIEKDIEHSQSEDDKEWKALWFEKWKMQVEQILNRKRKTIESLQILKNPNDKLTDTVDNLDIPSLYNIIRSPKYNVTKNWEITLYRQCVDFTPYDWFDLLQKEKQREKKWHTILYQKLQLICPNLKLDPSNNEKTLKNIANYLNIKS